VIDIDNSSKTGQIVLFAVFGIIAWFFWWVGGLAANLFILLLLIRAISVYFGILTLVVLVASFLPDSETNNQSAEEKADTRSKTIKHLDWLTRTRDEPHKPSDLEVFSDLWVETGFGGEVPELMIRQMQQEGMTQKQALIMMYREGFRPFREELIRYIPRSASAKFYTRGALRSMGPMALDNVCMANYQKALRRFFEKNYGRETSDYVLERFNSDEPL
jgi:hypothetical protein